MRGRVPIAYIPIAVTSPCVDPSSDSILSDPLESFINIFAGRCLKEICLMLWIATFLLR